MNNRHATFFLYFIALNFHLCLLQISPFEEVLKLPTFVDKTQLIKPLLTRTLQQQYFLFTCPHKFGKSVNLDMIKRFSKIYQDHAEENRTRGLFKNLKVGQDEEFFNKHFGKYAVMFIDLHTPTTANTYDGIIGSIRNATKRLYSEYEWLYEQNLKNNEKLNTLLLYSKRIFETILYKNPRLATEDDLRDSLNVLCDAIYTFYAGDIILLVDEYDSPILRATMNGNGAKKVTDLVDGMLGEVLKNKGLFVQCPYLYALITGITDITVESGESGESSLNNLIKYNFLDDDFSNGYCGFTENDMKDIFNKPKFHLTEEEKLLLKNSYNGYVDLLDNNSICIYNPFYLHGDLTETKKADPHKNIVKCKGLFDTGVSIFEKFHAYLKNEYILSIVAHLIRNRPFTFRKKESISDNDLEELESFTKTNAWWVNASESTYDTYFSFLFQHGYLTIANRPTCNDKISYKAPNDHIIANLDAALTRYLESYPNTTALFDVVEVFGTILRDQMELEKAEEALMIALTHLFKPIYEKTTLFNLHSLMYTCVLYGYWIRNLYYIVDGQARVDRGARGPTNFKSHQPHPGKVNMLMESFDRIGFLFVEMNIDRISEIEHAKKLTSNLTYKATLILHEEHPEKLPRTLLYLLLKQLPNKTTHVQFLPPLRWVRNITIDEDIHAIYE